MVRWAQGDCGQVSFPWWWRFSGAVSWQPNNVVSWRLSGRFGRRGENSHTEEYAISQGLWEELWHPMAGEQVGELCEQADKILHRHPLGPQVNGGVPCIKSTGLPPGQKRFFWGEPKNINTWWVLCWSDHSVTFWGRAGIRNAGQQMGKLE